MVSGPSRAIMFKAVDRMDGGRSRKRLADEFVRAVCGEWDKLLSGVFGSQTIDSISEEHRQSLEKIYQRTYEWNYKIKACLVTLDYHIYMPPHNSAFDGAKMLCLAEGEKNPGSIICAAWFGLSSSRAIGKQRSPEYVCRQKADILSEHYLKNL